MDIKELKKMPVAKRILLAQELWDSIDDGDKQKMNLSDEIKAELDNRIEHHRSGKATYYTIEEIRERNAKKRDEI